MNKRTLLAIRKIAADKQEQTEAQRQQPKQRSIAEDTTKLLADASKRVKAAYKAMTKRKPKAQSASEPQTVNQKQAAKRAETVPGTQY